jgi:hypothetical protein
MNTPLSNDPWLRSQELMRLKSHAGEAYRNDNPWRWFKSREKMSMLSLNDYQASRKYYDKMSRVTGKPFIELKDIAEEARQTGVLKFNDFHKSFYQTLGLKESAVDRMTPKQIANVATYLHEAATPGSTKTATLFKNLSPFERSVALTVQGATAKGSPVATEVSRISWSLLDDAYSKVSERLTKARLAGDSKKAGGLISQFMQVAPSDLKGKTQKAEKWLMEGRAAKNAGKFYEFLENPNNQFGVKEFHSIDAREYGHRLEVGETIMRAPTMESAERALAKLPYRPWYTQPKKARGTADTTTNPVVNLMQKAHQAMILGQSWDALKKFSNLHHAVKDRLTPHDIDVSENYFRAFTGRYQGLSAAASTAAELSGYWWRGYSWHPTNVLWFAARNVPQNFVVGSMQVSGLEATKALGRITTRGGPSKDAMKHYKEWFPRDIDMRSQQWRTLEMTRPELGKTASAKNLMNVGRHTMMGSDWGNRVSEFFILHEIYEHNLGLYRQNKISTKQLYSRLRLNTVEGGQWQRFTDYLKSGQDAELTKWLSVDKVRNTNYDYRRTGKSLLELDPNNQSYIGLRTWPVSYMESWYHQVVKPFMQGAKHKNGSMVYEAMKNGTAGIVMAYLGQEALRHTIGTKGFDFNREPYGFTGARWSPIAPGVTWGVETVSQAWKAFDETADLFKGMEDFRREGGKAEQFFDIWLSRGGRQLEYLLPLTDVAKELSDKFNDKDGIRFYGALKSAFTSYDAKHDRLLDDNFQNWREKVITGMFGTEYVEHEELWD